MARAKADQAPPATPGKRPRREELVEFTIHVQPELRRRLRRLCADEDLTMQELGVEALEALLAKREARRQVVTGYSAPPPTRWEMRGHGPGRQ